MPGPGDTIGSLALWGMRQEPVDLVGLGVVVALAAAAVVLAGRLRVEPLVRRGDLVSQLRFAVTMQDLRTVVLLRRQLRGEQPRGPAVGPARPPARRPRRRRGGVAARLAGVCVRYPVSRLVRMAALSIAAGVAAVAVLRGTTPAIVGIGLALYLLGLDAVEPLSQEIDHPDHTDGVPDRAGLAARPPRRRARRSPSCRSPCSARSTVGVLEPGTLGRRAGPVRPDVLGRHLRRGHQHRARRARPAEAGVGVGGGRAARVRRVHVDDPARCTRSPSAPLAGVPRARRAASSPASVRSCG